MSLDRAGTQDLNRSIERVREKIRCLPPTVDSEVFDKPAAWEPPLPVVQVETFESTHGLTLPPDYRAFITQVARAGTRPFYGLWGLGTANREFGDDLRPGQPFPFTASRPLDCFVLLDCPEGEAAYEAMWERHELSCGFVPLCTEGCGMNSVLVVKARDASVEGTVWYYDLANDAGIFPMRRRDGRPLTFLSWLECWLDAALCGSPISGFAEFVSLDD